MNDNSEKTASGLDCGFELENIVLEIIGDADEILEETLLDLLIHKPELQTLFAKFVEFVQKIPELKKKYGGKKNSRNTIRDELKILLSDLTNGAYHNMYQNGTHRKLERKVEYDVDNLRVFIRRITDEYNLR